MAGDERGEGKLSVFVQAIKKLSKRKASVEHFQDCCMMVKLISFTHFIHQPIGLTNMIKRTYKFKDASKMN